MKFSDLWNIICCFSRKKWSHGPLDPSQESSWHASKPANDRLLYVYFDCHVVLQARIVALHLTGGAWCIHGMLVGRDIWWRRFRGWRIRDRKTQKMASVNRYTYGSNAAGSGIRFKLTGWSPKAAPTCRYKPRIFMRAINVDFHNLRRDVYSSNNAGTYWIGKMNKKHENE